jgi:hypothetical protein
VTYSVIIKTDVPKA